LPSDLANFKKLTMGHPIIMGRKTYESIGRALPGRKNIIITRDSNFQAEGCMVVHSIEQALVAAEPAEEVFIIGGSSIFEEALPKADRIYLSRVNAEPDGDTYFSFDEQAWREISREHHPKSASDEYSYDFVLLERAEP
jgi:dihydrofolate reductase